MSERTFELKTREEFKLFIREYRYVIVKFTATWCGPCKRAAPVVESLFNEMPPDVVMLIVDIDKSPDIKNYLKVKSVPTLCNFINGDMTDTLSGSNKDHIISFFQKTYDKTSS